MLNDWKGVQGWGMSLYEGQTENDNVQKKMQEFVLHQRFVWHYTYDTIYGMCCIGEKKVSISMAEHYLSGQYCEGFGTFEQEWNNILCYVLHYVLYIVRNIIIITMVLYIEESRVLGIEISAGPGIIVEDTDYWYHMTYNGLLHTVVQLNPFLGYLFPPLAVYHIFMFPSEIAGYLSLGLFLLQYLNKILIMYITIVLILSNTYALGFLPLLFTVKVSPLLHL